MNKRSNIKVLMFKHGVSQQATTPKPDQHDGQSLLTNLGSCFAFLGSILNEAS